MALSSLEFNATNVTDLSPLQGMPLTRLWFGNAQVADLSPLKGMGLTSLACNGNKLSDLSPIAEMNLTEVYLTPKSITNGLDIIRQMKSLTTIGLDGPNKWPAAEFWKKYDAGEFGKPAAPAKLAYLDPAFQHWVADTQKLPAEQQIEAVSKRLMELNPGFDGKLTGGDGNVPPKIENGVVTSLVFPTDNVADISPVRALGGLKILHCSGSVPGKGRLSNLWPLARDETG